METTAGQGPDESSGAESHAVQLARRVRGLADAADVPASDELVLEAPQVFVGKRGSQPVQRIVSELAGLMKSEKYGMYRLGNLYGTIHANRKIGYEWRLMSTERLATWLPNDAQIIPYSGRDDNDKIVVSEFGDAVCKKLLSGDDLWRSAREVRAIHTLRMPVFREARDERGKHKLELLPYGYDEESQVYTLKGAAYPEDMPIQEAVEWIRRLLKYFEFKDERSRSVQIAAMLTAYCKLLFPGKAPGFFWDANMAGSGKSALARLCLLPVFRVAAMSGYSKENTVEVRKELDAAAQEGRSVVFFDNMPSGYISNADLDRWLTTETWQCRVMGLGKIWQGPLSCLTYMTGNDVKLSEDLGRRLLIVELFAHLRPKDRVLPDDAILLDDDFFNSAEMLGKTVGALYALLRYWDTEMDRRTGSGKPLASFTGWSKVIPGIVEWTGWGDCLAQVDSRRTGNVEGLEVELMVAACIKELAGELDRVEVTLKEVVGVTRRAGLFVEQLGTIDDVLETEGTQKGFNPRHLTFDTETARRKAAAEFLTASQNSGWGKRFRRDVANGRHFFGKDGALWEFSDVTREGGTSTFALEKVREFGLKAAP
jgi:hypothetical protein